MNSTQIAALYLAGGLIGGFIAMKIADKIWPDELPQEQPAEEPTEELPDEVVVSEPVIEDDKPEIIAEQPGEETIKVAKKRKKTAEVTDYTAVFNKPKRAAASKPKLADLAAKYPEATEQPSEKEPPAVISFEEFSEQDGRQKITLTYYAKDKVLCDGSDEIIDDLRTRQLIGPDALQKFGLNSDDPDIVYVRNKRLGYDYEVIRNKSSYAEEILSLDDDSEEFEERMNRRKGRTQDEDDR